MTRTAGLNVEKALGWPLGRIGGLDEVGRGAAAGPVVVAIAVLPEAGNVPPGLTDSKQLSAERRTQMAATLGAWLSDHAIGAATAAEIDEHGMSKALSLAARRALNGLDAPLDGLVVDGPHDYVRAGVPTRALPQADVNCASSAAASILAKVARDQLMKDLGRMAPQYGLGEHYGYLTPQHQRALREYGPTALHRTSWKWMDYLPQWQHRRRVGSQLTLL